MAPFGIIEDIPASSSSPCLWPPRVVMHPCVALMTAATPSGRNTFWVQSAS